jgi:general secretion pathway protein G
LKQQNYKKAFSLMELMVVIIILGLLASFVYQNLTTKSEDAKIKLSCIQMTSIMSALKMYKIDNSTYPTTKQGLKLLVDKNYFEDKKIPKDSWKQEYIYINTNNNIELLSLGSDKKEGSSDDIYFSKCETK